MRKHSGQSLVQVLVATAILVILLTAMASMFNSLNHETRSVGEKIGAMDLEKLLIASLADGTSCLYALTNPTPVTFDSTAAMSPASPKVITLPSSTTNPARLYSSYNPSATPPLGPVVVQVGQAAAPYSSSLVVSAINLELTGISGSLVTGRWRIDFDNTRLVRPLKPLYISVILKADTSTPTSAKFTSCQEASGASGGGGNGNWCGAFLGGPDGVTGSGIYIYQVLLKCQNTPPACPSGMTSMSSAAGPCMQSPFIYGYDKNSVCPSGYHIAQVSASGGAQTDLFTCTPN